MSSRQRVLVISKNDDLGHELVTILSGYGYFVEHVPDRMEGMRRFRAHKQSILIFDVHSLRRFSKRIFAMIKTVQKNAIVLVAANPGEEELAFQQLKLGAYDILSVPLKMDFLKLTLNRALDHHKLILDNLFARHALFFAGLMLPVWVAALFVFLR